MVSPCSHLDLVAFHAAATLSLAPSSAPAIEPAPTSFSMVITARLALVAASAVAFVSAVASVSFPR